MPTVERPDFTVAGGYLRRLAARPGEVLAETSPVVDFECEEGLRRRGWEVGYSLPVHLIPVRDPAWPLRLRDLPPGHTIREVTDEKGLADYAFVQELAHRESYDLPRGSTSLFYASLASVCGPDVLAAVLYDDRDQPVRTACVYRSHGLVSGAGGAAVPRVRGAHLGEPLMRWLTRPAVEVFGAHEVIHITMPVARPIAQRLGFPVIDQYRRWVPGGGAEW